MTTMSENPALPLLAPILSAVKDVDSNVRSELYALDRNIGNNILASNLETKDVVNRNSEFALNDTRRNFDYQNNANNRNFENVITDGRRNADFGLNDSRRNTEFVLSDSHRAYDLINSAVERNGTAGVLATQTASTNLGTAIERTGGASVLATQSAANGLGSAIERTGAAAVLATQSESHQGIVATQTTANAIGSALERVGAAGVLATQSANSNLSGAIERTGGAAVLATQTIGSNLLNSIDRVASEITSDTIREAGATRDLINQQHQEQRTMMNGINKDVVSFGYASQIASKDSDIKNAEYAKQTQLQTQAMGQTIGMEVLKMKADLEKQNLEIANSAARDSAALARQSAENTAAIQIEALKNKDALSFQINDVYRGLKTSIIETDSARLRDNQNDSRIESMLLKYGHHNHHDHHDHHRRPDTYIYNNLENDRRRSPYRGRSPHRERPRDREPRDER